MHNQNHLLLYSIRTREINKMHRMNVYIYEKLGRCELARQQPASVFMFNKGGQKVNRKKKI